MLLWMDLHVVGSLEPADPHVMSIGVAGGWFVERDFDETLQCGWLPLLEDPPRGEGRTVMSVTELDRVRACSTLND